MRAVSSKIVVFTILISFSSHEVQPKPNKGVSSQCCEDGLPIGQAVETPDIDRIVHHSADNKSNVYYIDLYGESSNGSVNNKVIIINKLVSGGVSGEESGDQIDDLAAPLDIDSNLNGTSTLMNETVETDSSVNDLPGFTSNATNDELDDEGEAIVEDVEDVDGLIGSTAGSYSDHEIATNHWFDDISSSYFGSWYEDILNAIEKGESGETSSSEQKLEDDMTTASYSGEDHFEPETEEDSVENTTDNRPYLTDAAEITNGNTGHHGHDSSTHPAESHETQPFVGENSPSLLVTPEVDETDGAEDSDENTTENIPYSTVTIEISNGNTANPGQHGYDSSTHPAESHETQHFVSETLTSLVVRPEVEDTDDAEDSEENTTENIPYSTDTAEISNGNFAHPGQNAFWTESSTFSAAIEGTQPVASENHLRDTSTLTTDANTELMVADEDDNSFPSGENEETLPITSETNHSFSSVSSTETLTVGNPSNSEVTDQPVTADDGNSFSPEKTLPSNSEDLPTSTLTSTTVTADGNAEDDNTSSVGTIEILPEANSQASTDTTVTTNNDNSFLSGENEETLPTTSETNQTFSSIMSTETLPDGNPSNSAVTPYGITDQSVSADNSNSFPPEETLPFNSEDLQTSTLTSTTLTTGENAEETESGEDDTTSSSAGTTEILPEASTETTVTTNGITDQIDSTADGNSLHSEVGKEIPSFTSGNLPSSIDISSTMTTDGSAEQTGSSKDDTTDSSVVTTEVLSDASGDIPTSTDTTVIINEITHMPESTGKYSTSHSEVDTLPFTIAYPSTSTDATITTIDSTNLTESVEDNHSSTGENQDGLYFTSDLSFTNNGITNNSGSVPGGNGSLEEEREATGNLISSTDSGDTTNDAITFQPGFVENYNISTSVVGVETQPTSEDPSSYTDFNETTYDVDEQTGLSEDSSYPSEDSEETLPSANGNFLSSTDPGSTEENTVPSLPDTLALNDSTITDDNVTSSLPADINPLVTSTNISDTSEVNNSNTPITFVLPTQDTAVSGAQIIMKPPIPTIAPNVQNTYYPPHFQVLYPIRPTHPPFMPQTSKAPLMDSTHNYSLSTVPPRAPISYQIPNSLHRPPGGYVIPNVPFHSVVPSYPTVPNAYYPHHQFVRPLPISRPYSYQYNLPHHNQQYLPPYSYSPFWRSGKIDSTKEPIIANKGNQSYTNEMDI